MINKQDANNLLLLLARVDLKGNEAIAFVQLQQKLQEIAQSEDKEEKKK